MVSEREKRLEVSIGENITIDMSFNETASSFDPLRICTPTGANLSNGVNETGFTENAYWLDGRMRKVDSMMFNYDGQDIRRPWTITSFDEQVDLTFTPVDGYGAFSEREGAENRFDQLFRSFAGRLGKGQYAVEVIDLWGFLRAPVCCLVGLPTDLNG